MGKLRMKTTVELPDATFQRYVQEIQARETEMPWMAGFGAFSDLANENQRVLRLIEEEFEVLDPEDTAGVKESRG